MPHHQVITVQCSTLRCGGSQRGSASRLPREGVSPSVAGVNHERQSWDVSCIAKADNVSRGWQHGFVGCLGSNLSGGG
jgi:hypothetical protein